MAALGNGEMFGDELGLGLGLNSGSWISIDIVGPSYLVCFVLALVNYLFLLGRRLLLLVSLDYATPKP